MHVPVITQHDLDAYHRKHFPLGRVPGPLQQVSPDHLEDPEEYNEDEDGLGYYDDGVKRTLTDEQIAMFRHSEIQALLKERRLREEAAEYDHEAEASSPVVTVSTTKPASPEPNIGQSQVGSTERLDAPLSPNSRADVEPTTKKKKRSHRAARKKQKRKAGDVRQQAASNHTNAVTVPSTDTPPRHTSDAPTMNRLARELDDAKTGIIELDY